MTSPVGVANRQATFSRLHASMNDFAYEEIPVQKDTNTNPGYNEHRSSNRVTDDNTSSNRQQNVPTLKRKISEWEKIQIEKEWRKL